MHSRKPRLNDGYYETQNRNFQNSKYNSNRYSNYYRDRESSPKRVAHRSVSPEGSPRDRYHQGSSYRNKDREREYKKDKYSDKRGRDREVEYKSYNKKAKTRERSSSDEEHKDADRLYDKARYAERDSVRRPPEKERKFGDWKEMISKGSGKKYYYNERDKSSQWEKPEEWVEYEMAKNEYPPRGYRDKDRDRKSRGGDDRYNNSRRSFSSSKHSRGNSRARWPHDNYGVQPSTSSSLGHHKRHDDNPDMDISPDSTPTSEPSYSSPTANNQHINSSNINSNSMNHEDLVVASPNGKHSSLNSNNQLHHQMSNASSTSVSSASRLLSNSNKNSTIASSSPSTHNYANYHMHMSHHRHRSGSPNEIIHHNNIGHETNNLHHNSNSLRNSPAHGTLNVNSGAAPRLDHSNSNHLIGDGPPTPEMDLNSAGDHRRIDGASGVNSLQSVMSGSQTSNRLNLLTPSLAKFFRADLIQHVTNWPSELLEKQTQKCAEEVYLLGDLDCSRISAEIQCARSIVRVAEIAATIQGQRRNFLSEQIKSLEDSQTQNSSAISY